MNRSLQARAKVGCRRPAVVWLFVGALRLPEGFLSLMSEDRNISKNPFSVL